jgi:hypothetical protein
MQTSFHITSQQESEFELPQEKFGARSPEGARTERGFMPVARLTVQPTFDPPAKGWKRRCFPRHDRIRRAGLARG